MQIDRIYTEYILGKELIIHHLLACVPSPEISAFNPFIFLKLYLEDSSTMLANISDIRVADLHLPVKESNIDVLIIGAGPAG